MLSSFLFPSLISVRSNNVLLSLFPPTLSIARAKMSREDVILIAITSNIESSFKSGNYAIKGAEQKRSGLLQEGVVLVGKIITIDQRLIRGRLGTLSPTVLREISERVSKIIG